MYLGVSKENQFQMAIQEINELEYSCYMQYQRIKSLEEVISRMENYVQILGGEVEHHVIKHTLPRPIRRFYGNDTYWFVQVEPFLKGFLDTKHEILHKIEINN